MCVHVHKSNRFNFGIISQAALTQGWTHSVNTHFAVQKSSVGHFLNYKWSTFSYLTHPRFLTVIHLSGILIGTLRDDYHQHILSDWMPSATPLFKKKKKKKQSYAWEEADKESQTGRRERQNLIKFNKAERIAQAVKSDSAFFPFTTSAYLNTFTPPPFICVCIHWERNSWTQGETLIPFLFECWPRMATICANCPTMTLLHLLP